jgi:hypothetical protein
VDDGAQDPPVFYVNIADAYYDDGPGSGNPEVVRLSKAGTTDMSNSSEFSILRIRTDSGMCADDWDTGCVGVQTNTEANLRDDAIDRYPTGAVSTNISSMSDEDVRTLMFQNNGPHPNNRVTDWQAVYDGMDNGTLTISNTFSYTYPTDTSGTYSVPASPHADTSPANGIPDLMDQFETERRAMYAN